jgi:Protein of unknown function (DUF1420)
MSLNEMGANHSFLRLEDLLLAPPLPAIVSLLIVLGTLNLSTLGARWLKTENKTSIELAAAFVVTTGLLAALLHAVAWAGYASLPMLRWVGWALAGLGILELGKWKPGKLVSLLGEYWREGSRVERFALIISVLTLIGLFAAALGPPTDADSLEYHLGVPLDWLRHGGAYPRPDWLHARLVGLGEPINMLGLAAGTDSLGAVFQVAGLIVALIGVTAFAMTRKERVFAVLFVVVCPVMVSLVTTQKWQLFPSAGLTLALVLVFNRFDKFDRKTAVLVFGCVSFAIGSKYSFLLPASVIVFIALIAAFRAKQFSSAVLLLALSFSLMALPVFARNVVFYGDPISPLLERWRAGADPGVIAFAEHLRNFGGRANLERFLRLPWDLTATIHPRMLHDVLGLGAFGFLLAVWKPRLARGFLLSALCVFVLVATLSQLTPRFFLEVYLWCAVAATLAPWGRLKEFFFRALNAQGVGVAVIALYLGVVLFGGSLTWAGRERVMTAMASGYSEAKWLDAKLPADAVVLENFRYRALLPRPFIAGDRFLMKDVGDSTRPLAEFVKEQHVTALVTSYPIENPAYRWLAAHYGAPLAGPAKFPSAARSPFNRGDLSEWIVIRINVNGPPLS